MDAVSFQPALSIGFLRNFNIYMIILSSCVGCRGVHLVDAGERRKAGDIVFASILQHFEFVMFEEVVRSPPSCQPVAFGGGETGVSPRRKAVRCIRFRFIRPRFVCILVMSLQPCADFLLSCLYQFLFDCRGGCGYVWFEAESSSCLVSVVRG